MSFSRDSGCIKQQVFQKDLSLYPDFQSEAHSCVNPPTLVGGSLVTNVRYADVNNIDVNNLPLLHSALISKETNCDGFANAISLLFNMAGIECFKIGYGEENKKQYFESEGFKKLSNSLSFSYPAAGDGHIWNIAKIDDNYYHIDASDGAQEYERLNGKYNDTFYCMSDSKLTLFKVGVQGNSNISEYLPKCDIDIKTLIIVNKKNKDRVISDISNLLKNDGYVHFYINIDSIKDSSYICDNVFYNSNSPTIEYEYYIDLINQYNNFLITIYN